MNVTRVNSGNYNFVNSHGATGEIYKQHAKNVRGVWSNRKGCVVDIVPTYREARAVAAELEIGENNMIAFDYMQKENQDVMFCNEWSNTKVEMFNQLRDTGASTRIKHLYKGDVFLVIHRPGGGQGPLEDPEQYTVYRIELSDFEPKPVGRSFFARMEDEDELVQLVSQAEVADFDEVSTQYKINPRFSTEHSTFILIYTSGDEDAQNVIEVHRVEHNG